MRSPEVTIGIVLRIAIGLVLLRAATAKMTGFTAFSETIAGLGVSRQIAHFVAWAFVVTEGGIALWVLSSWAPGVAAVGCLLLLTGLVLVSVYAMSTGRDVPCSCFGASDRSLGSQTLMLSGPLLAGQATYLLIGLTSARFPGIGLAELPVALALALILIVFVSGLAASPTLVMIVRHRRRLAAMEVQASAAQRVR